jgi:4-diphosphocytidyl-2-C-methyl-D-erythritol kinase
MSAARALRLLAPAKINLHLRVGPRRDDGFHPLLSWMTTIGLFDTLSLTDSTAADSSSPNARKTDRPTQDRSDGVVMSCDDAALPCDGRNLVVKAAVLYRQYLIDERTRAGRAGAAGGSAGRSGKAVGSPRTAAVSSAGALDPEKLRVSIHLQKRIPAGGGLGGGSSDAAVTLLGLSRLWVTLVGEADEGAEDARGLRELAAKLGSDVAFFLFGPSSICSGRGEVVRPIGAPVGQQAGAKWVTLVLPPIAMPTPDVYRRFDSMNLGRGQNIEQEPVWNKWVPLGSCSLLAKLVNDLEAPAFALRPDLGELRAAIEQTLGRIVRMSGSGSSLFTLFDSKEEAVVAASRITSKHGVRAIAVELCPTIHDDLSEVREA